jgi:hypothetical protein
MAIDALFFPLVYSTAVLSGLRELEQSFFFFFSFLALISPRPSLVRSDDVFYQSEKNDSDDSRKRLGRSFPQSIIHQHCDDENDNDDASKQATL